MADGERRRKVVHFSLELRTRQQIRRLSLPTQQKGMEEDVLIEGSLGKIEKAEFVEGVLLELRGTGGTLKLDMGRRELLRFLGEEPRTRPARAELRVPRPKPA